MSEVS